MKRKKLVIISHTEHFINENDEIVGWGSTINEVNFLADYWETVCHIGCLYKTKDVPPSSLPYTKSNIQFVPIPPYGGKKIIDKIKIITKIPQIVSQVYKTIDGATEVQLRLPTSIGLFLLPLFSFFIPRKFTFWVKYAGNWNQGNPPLSYKIQRWWLKNNFANCKVTINGFWDNQPKHCYSFENPCLTLDDIENGTKIANKKIFNKPYVFAFVGRLEKQKGVDTIIDAFNKIPAEDIDTIHFIGGGNKTDFYKEKASSLGNKVKFHGFLEKMKINELLIKSHFFLLPSQSEGFPKVIAEAACYGVIPIVSNVGSISHYVNETNGYVWNLNSEVTFAEVLNVAIINDSEKLSAISCELLQLAKKFTFVNYFNKLETLILKE